MTILDVSRIEAGRLSLHPGPVAVEPLLARACASTLGADIGRQWSLTVPPGLPPAWADEVLLEEVVRNLLQNAVQYSPADGAIDVSATLSDGAIRVAVVDHGPGVSPDEHDLIFQSFHRIGDDDTTVRGYGLGLYFADKLVGAMGGKIGIESPIWPDPEAPGTRFAFTLPVAADDGSADDDDEPPGSDDGDGQPGSDDRPAEG